MLKKSQNGIRPRKPRSTQRPQQAKCHYTTSSLHTLSSSSPSSSSPSLLSHNQHGASHSVTNRTVIQRKFSKHTSRSSVTTTKRKVTSPVSTNKPSQPSENTIQLNTEPHMAPPQPLPSKSPLPSPPPSSSSSLSPPPTLPPPSSHSPSISIESLSTPSLKQKISEFATSLIKPKPREDVIYTPIKVSPNQPEQKQLDTNLPGTIIYALDTKAYDKITHSILPPLSVVVMSLGALSAYHWDIPSTTLWVGAALAASLNIYARSDVVTRISVETHPQLDKHGKYPKAIDTKSIQKIHVETYGFPLSPRIVKSFPMASFSRIGDDSFYKRFINVHDVETSIYTPMFQTIKLNMDNKQHQLYVDQIRNISYFNQILSYTDYVNPNGDGNDDNNIDIPSSQTTTATPSGGHVSSGGKKKHQKKQKM